MPTIKQKEWDKYVKINKDPYGKACIDTARRVMEILDKEKEFNCREIISRASDEVKTGGLTGCMAGIIAEAIWQYHSRGEEFRKKWNKDYGVKSKDGIVNPAILTIKT